VEIERFLTTFRFSPNEPPPQPGEIRTLHFIAKPSFKIDGDTAIGGAYWQTIGVTDLPGTAVAAATATEPNTK
jgi:hypothetical protein